MKIPERFTLEAGQWYGLTMFPGYFDVPYHSPIKVSSVTPLGDRQFELAFLNLAYAQGVQNFKKRLKTLRRANSHLVAAETEVEDRTYVISSLNPAWMQRHFPTIDSGPLFDRDGKPLSEALLGPLRSTN